MIDLSDARLGINEADDDYDGYSASHGAEVKNVISSLHICSQLKLLNLQGNWLGNFTIMTQFPNIVRNFTLLQSLNLANTALSERENLEKASEALIFLPHLEHLNLSSNGFNSDAFYGLMKGLCALKNIITLNLSYNRLAWGCNYEEDYKGRCEESTHDTLGWIINYIHGTPSLKRVNVKNNSFGTIEFDWKDIKDEAGITTQELRRARAKLKIEEESGNDYSDSEEEYSDNEEEEN
jgi:Ran GTPase-activating protein (RanGAP) involved in mRNA processing and transport